MDMAANPAVHKPVPAHQCVLHRFSKRSVSSHFAQQETLGHVCAEAPNKKAGSQAVHKSLKRNAPVSPVSQVFTIKRKFGGTKPTSNNNNVKPWRFVMKASTSGDRRVLTCLGRVGDAELDCLEP